MQRRKSCVRLKSSGISERRTDQRYGYRHQVAYCWRYPVPGVHAAGNDRNPTGPDGLTVLRALNAENRPLHYPFVGFPKGLRPLGGGGGGGPPASPPRAYSSSSSGSSSSSSAPGSRSTTMPPAEKASRRDFEIDSYISGCSLMYLRVLSRPWPMRWSS